MAERELGTFDTQRQQFLTDFFASNWADLADRMRDEKVKVVADSEVDIFSLAIGPVQEAEGFSADGELYFRTLLDNHKLIGIELHNFRRHLREDSPQLRLMLNFIRLAGPVQLVLLPEMAAGPVDALKRDLRNLVTA
jgi:hypothetical protein